MSWNYRIIRHTGTTKIGDQEINNSHLAIHEVHYDEEGNPIARSMKPISFCCDVDEGKDGIIASLERALRTIRETEILDDPWPNG